MPETFNPTVLLTYQRTRERAAAARAERALARLGSSAREDRGPRAKRRKMAPLSAEQRAAAYRAKRGPLAWLFTGSSPEDVIADSSFLKKLVAIHRMRPELRRTGRSIVHLRNGGTVKFNPRTGEVLRP
jgi:hypothetical protein